MILIVLCGLSVLNLIVWYTGIRLNLHFLWCDHESCSKSWLGFVFVWFLVLGIFACPLIVFSFSVIGLFVVNYGIISKEFNVAAFYVHVHCILVHCISFMYMYTVFWYIVYRLCTCTLYSGTLYIVLCTCTLYSGTLYIVYVHVHCMLVHCISCYVHVHCILVHCISFMYMYTVF